MNTIKGIEGVTAASSVPLSSLPPPPPASSLRPSRRVWWALPLFTIAWLLIVVMFASSLTRVQLWELAPGSAEAVSPRMTFGDDVREFATVYESDGEVMFVTALGSRLSLLDVAAAWLDDDVDILTFEERFGTQTPTQQRESNSRAMVSSKQIAEFVALTRLGIESEFAYGDVIVDEVVCEDLPDPQSACRLLQPGDVIVTFNGKPTPTLPSLIEVVAASKPGDLAEVGVRREGSETEQTIAIKLISAPDGSGRTIIGLMPRDTRTVKTPFEVGIDTDSIGGPSAGLAFTLALLDELSKGSLTGKVKVAATGTINGDETVGAVGAIPQKAIAARDSGAKLLLVPATQSADDIAAARRIGGSRMRVETVASLQEALDILRGLGGDALPDSTNDE
ncbi:MAG: PDZ domain-containing protein [Actinomycetota bacterium]